MHSKCELCQEFKHHDDGIETCKGIQINGEHKSIFEKCDDYKGDDT
jgi:hypothetical protein